MCVFYRKKTEQTYKQEEIRLKNELIKINEKFNVEKQIRKLKKLFHNENKDNTYHFYTSSDLRNNFSPTRNSNPKNQLICHRCLIHHHPCKKKIYRDYLIEQYSQGEQLVIPKEKDEIFQTNGVAMNGKAA